MLAELFRLLRRLWPISALATLMGTASGIATAALLAVTNRALHDGAASLPALLASFAGLCALALAGEVISDIGNNLVGQRVIAALRKNLCAKIIAAPISEIEQFRSHRLIAALNQDIDTISAFSFMFSSLAIATATVAGCLGYLFVLSPLLFLIALAALALGSIAQSLARRVGIRRFGAAREAEDRLQKHYRAMVDGAKELRINRERRTFVYGSELSGTIDAIFRLRVRAANVFVTANAFGSLLFFVVIGLMLALHGGVAGADRAALTGFVLVLLYMKGPIQEIVGALPSIGRAQVAFRRVAELSARFASGETALLDARAATPGYGERFSTIALSDVAYRFPAPLDDSLVATQPDARGFALGPLSLTVQRGETLFIVGENGCGKTTLIKLLLGLYEPETGTLLVDGAPVRADQRDAYRQLFSVVFSDYYLFDTLLPGDDTLRADAQRYLERLALAHKVSVRDGAFSTTDLSTGQRKRLALVHAYLENRPVLVLDEWAADQDPTFRRIFYAEILPDLKRQGKTLIVISHDDRYFGAADRYVRIEDGRIVEEVRPGEAVEAAAASRAT
ncbi:cyclic peptide export ABC transporter [Paraburkholderia caballeronis]|uniref:Putative ATP-binding cassette transporter n=1 Tax=Paraburkholderia caballeronis TaxID=416943 RepID=A0A1H7LZQ9_9BURK|nr:cyclic peptide export ABC transporter [Paraburkholderia caballeronis]PXW28667.1 putative ATP-binding cassette transporter [Paraburkholderia caballeronis]PXX04033.1 putative ATP-binding cassette transporter [Paraburkholderia caballeronis]RAK04777.1 putative ATP-binding cassette transporter [Paraburkholderia caballeronis]SED65470.1 putative ATP-binding cassette transporter [Paraburkholderia caballeronis]SEL04463.1 putative ATP-binding cassette transporter [Paraburkholderia caballeronis]